MNKYYIRTLSGERLLERCKQHADKNQGYVFDVKMIEKTFDYKFFVECKELNDDNALFYQLRRVLGLKLDSNEDKDEYALQDAILFVNFNKLFSSLLDEKEDDDGKAIKLKSLIEKGLTIKFSNDGEDVHFVPFDKSGSMTRNSKISFINEKYLDEMNRCLNMDYDFNKISVIHSKYYAYRGLYLSNSQRVVCSSADAIDDKYKLDASKIIVVRDKNIKVKDSFFGIAYNFDTEEYEDNPSNDTTFDVFDGAGIISPEFAGAINKELGLEGANSYQIRMPFTKGMLHNVNFKKFYRDKLNLKEDDELIIKDYYGKDRDIMKAEIIIPHTMFKGCKWFAVDENSDEDPMEIYFTKFHDYHHALYISNTDLPYINRNYTRLNYQFISTLALSDSDFEKMVQQHLDWSKDPLSYMNYVNPVEDEKGDLKKNISSWKLALIKNSDCINDPKIHGIMESESMAIKMNLALGKLVVEGEVRFLVRDLLYFLRDIIPDKYFIDNNRRNELQSGKKIGKLFNDQFYMPGASVKHNPDDEYSNYYPVFRNPHLSRNEQCALQMWGKSKDDYGTYLGHLQGVYMVSYNSLAPMALGGADFDGDLVKVIFDNHVRKAVLDEVYTKNNEDKGPRYIRNKKYPIIKIEANYKNQPEGYPNTQTLVVPKTISYELLRNTFANRVGRLSNESIRLADFEYGIGAEAYRNRCAMCTILTGLDIDAAKNGAHPNLLTFFSYFSGFDYVNHFKEKIEKISESNQKLKGTKIEKIQDGETTDYRLFRSTKEKKDIDLIIFNSSGATRNINKLPLYFFEDMNETNCKSSIPPKKKCGVERLFWIPEVNDSKLETVQIEIGEYMSAYYSMKKTHRVIKAFMENVDKSYEGHINNVLDKQYVSEYIDEMENECRFGLENLISDRFTDYDFTMAAIKQLSKKGTLQWPFMPESERKAYLESDELFGADAFKWEEKALKYVTNFYSRGFMLLLYELLQWRNILNEDFASRIIKEDETTENTIYTQKYIDLRKKYLEWTNESKSNLMGEVFKFCNERIIELLNGNNVDREESFKIFCNLTKTKDKSREFFWDFIKNKDVEEYLINVDGGRANA